MIELLTERQLLILEAIIQDYTNAGRPVGSKFLEQQLPMNVSSATIRNEMAVLEHLGFIGKEHSSSGRVPSLKGYRYYVDNLVKPDEIDQNEIESIRLSLDSNYYKVDEIIKESAKILSEMTNYTAITFKPEVKNLRFQGFRVLPLGNQQVMMILITSDGNTESQLFNLPRDLSGDEIEAVIRVINDRIVGLPLDQVIARLHETLPLLLHYVQHPLGFLDIFGSILERSAQEQFFVGGKLNLLNFVGDGDVEQIKKLYSLIERSDDINELVGNSGQTIQVKIGDELTNSSLANYSLISATYDVAQHGQGLIALLGPTNMPYSKMIGLMRAFREELTRKLLDYYHLYEE
ncbi:heat-inducible transcription repressor [Liquorilactobacillus satsumensis DSM 16230 = JCM 12392]|uniref:Heat-inducible transcription repressor HrcA n=1 Tax=Liquorilactobacillus satsumensis DSM 16230 = JCM 12392 TaxID=1423801 RepID=A0A0R1V1N2_9LACO|nr:heat-inducible transcription repressor [Liquorilactobacillus satsumensis DSM 16230 = JCM 12392]